MSAQSADNQQSSLALRTRQMIGRPGIAAKIQEVIRGDDPCCAFYIMGLGGMGKTRLLEEVETWQFSDEKRPVLVSPIIDLYHAENHSPSGLRRAIANGFDPEQLYFAGYHERREFFLQRRREGYPLDLLENLREELEETFAESYARLAQDFRLVLRVDTLELTQHDSDLVQELCQVHDVDTEIGRWLVNRLPSLPNTVSLLAGRPEKSVQETLQQAFSLAKIPFEIISLEALNKEETLAYLNDLRQQRPELLKDRLTPENCAKLYELTHGRPVYLALLVDFLIYGKGKELNLSPTSESILRQKLIGMLQNDLPDPLVTILNALVYVRKGLTPALMCVMAPSLSVAEIYAGFAQAKQLAIVKERQRMASQPSNTVLFESSENDQLFLHDEVSDLFDEFYRDAPEYNQAIFREIADYYAGLQKNANAERSQRNAWQVAQLYYELQANPRKGYYECYVRWDEENIQSHEVGHDMRLRDEGLQFINRYGSPATRFGALRVYLKISRQEIDLDCAVRWVRRYIARGHNERAHEVAHTLRYTKRSEFRWDQIKDPVYKAGLLTAWSETLNYLGKNPRLSEANLIWAIRLLSKPNITVNSAWLRWRVLGQAHNNLGYLYWAQGRYGRAHDQFRQALPYFTRAEIADEEANTLNNLAFLVACLGRLTVARELCLRAYKIRDERKREYPLALSLNTLGYIDILAYRPNDGRKKCEKALEKFKEFNAPRGQGLALLALGLAHRKLGERWKRELEPDLSEAERFFQTGKDYLEKAKEIFTLQVKEPIRLWEAWNELGSLYCDWGWLAWKGQGNLQSARDHYEESLQAQKKALELARQTQLEFQEIDSLDDLAQAGADLSFLLLKMDKAQEAALARRDAEASLTGVQTKIRPGFSLRPGVGFQEAPPQGEFPWLVLGKVHLWRGVWLFRDVEEGLKSLEVLPDAFDSLLTAMTYFQRFEPSSYMRERTIGYFSGYARQHQAQLSNELIQQRIDDFAERYAVDMHTLEETLADVLGV
jgi:hypothetical protein